MTIQELKEKKQALEKEISEKICAFEKETDLQVTDIKTYKSVYSFCSGAYTEERIRVNIEVKL